MCRMETESTNTVKSIERATEIIEAIRKLEGASVNELSDELGYPKSTLYSHLNTLREAGYLIKENSLYRVSLQFLELGEYSRRRKELYHVGHPEIEALASKTSEVVILAVEENGQAVCLDIGRGSNAIRHDTHPGQRMPLYCTGVGKSILAYLPDERQEQILDQLEFVGRTPSTITGRETLTEELESVRERGLAFDNQEYHRGLRCVAKPIRNERGKAIGAISVSGPTSRMKDEQFQTEIPNAIRETTNIIEVNMSQSPY